MHLHQQLEREGYQYLLISPRRAALALRRYLRTRGAIVPRNVERDPPGERVWVVFKLVGETLDGRP